MSAFGWLVAGLLVGAGGGVAGAWWFLKGRTQSPTYRKLQKDHEQFREEVTDHFVETAQLINQLTDSYKAIFDHLSDGADRLVDPDTLRQRLPATGDKEVRLRRIGAGDSRQNQRRKPEDTDSDDPIGI